ncbi:MAG: hypothetical protein ACJ8J0_05770 [Longimicrobiaceae bacterium]
MPPSFRTIALAVLVGAAGCARPPCCAPPAPAGGEAALVREARAFMDAYARDLREGNRNGIVERYDPRGAYFVGQGRKELVPADSIRAIYRGRWQPPAGFEWRDLSYEVAGPDAVVVAGLFVWSGSNGRSATYSYTGLLLRQGGRLRIRLEDESPAPPPRPAPAPAPAP